MTLEVDENRMIIMGVEFQDVKVFKSVWYAVSSNIIEGWSPTKEDIVSLKNKASKLFGENNG